MRFDQTTIVIESRDEQRKRFGSWKANISARDFSLIDWRAIDTRPPGPDMAFTADDTDWGEQDSGARPTITLAEKMKRQMTCSTEDRGDA